MDRYAHLMKFMEGQLWAIVPEKLAAIRDVIRLRAEGVRFSDSEIKERLGLAYDEEPPRPQPARHGGVAILPLYGFLCPKANMVTEFSGGTSLQAFARAFRQAMSDGSVGSIVLDVDSPGGSVYGVEEMAAEIMAARGVKRVVAAVNPSAGSAAYWIASAAEEIIITPSGDCGSVGVYALHEDHGGAMEKAGVKVEFIQAGDFKTEGNPYAPLSEEGRAYIQGQINACYASFVKGVAKGRGVSVAEVAKEFGQGRMVMAREAVARKMADRLGTLEETVARLAGKKGGTRAASVALTDAPEVVAEAAASEPGDDDGSIHVRFMEDVEGGHFCNRPACEKCAVASEPAPSPEQPPTTEAQPDPAAERERWRARVELQELG